MFRMTKLLLALPFVLLASSIVHVSLANPDFAPDIEYMKTSLLLSRLDTRNADEIEGLNLECLINEGCIGGYGVRTLLRFGTKIDNVGSSPYVAGHPPAYKGDVGPWHWDTCHSHWHFQGYAKYTLRPIGGGILSENSAPVRPVIHGRKNGFCLMDTRPAFAGGYCDEKFDCCNQGLNAGCSDIYSNNLDCQWIDITGVNRTSGQYRLEVEVNPGGDYRVIQEELNYRNNKIALDVDLQKVYWIPLERIEEAPDAGVNCSDVLRQVDQRNPTLRDRGQYDPTCESAWLYVDSLDLTKGAEGVQPSSVGAGVDLLTPLRPDGYAFYLMTETPQCFDASGFTHVGFGITAPPGSDVHVSIQVVEPSYGETYDCDAGNRIFTYTMPLSRYVTFDGAVQHVYIPLDHLEEASGRTDLIRANVKAVVFSQFQYGAPGTSFKIENLHFRRVCSPRGE